MALRSRHCYDAAATLSGLSVDDAAVACDGCCAGWRVTFGTHLFSRLSKCFQSHRIVAKRHVSLETVVAFERAIKTWL